MSNNYLKISSSKKKSKGKRPNFTSVLNQKKNKQSRKKNKRKKGGASVSGEGEASVPGAGASKPLGEDSVEGEGDAYELASVPGEGEASVLGAGASETREEASESLAEEASQPIQKNPEKKIEDLFKPPRRVVDKTRQDLVSWKTMYGESSGMLDKIETFNKDDTRIKVIRGKDEGNRTETERQDLKKYDLKIEQYKDIEEQRHILKISELTRPKILEKYGERNYLKACTNVNNGKAFYSGYVQKKGGLDGTTWQRRFLVIYERLNLNDLVNVKDPIKFPPKLSEKDTCGPQYLLSWYENANNYSGLQGNLSYDGDYLLKTRIQTLTGKHGGEARFQPEDTKYRIGSLVGANYYTKTVKGTIQIDDIQAFDINGEIIGFEQLPSIDSLKITGKVLKDGKLTERTNTVHFKTGNNLELLDWLHALHEVKLRYSLHKAYELQEYFAVCNLGGGLIHLGHKEGELTGDQKNKIEKYIGEAPLWPWNKTLVT